MCMTYHGTLRAEIPSQNWESRFPGIRLLSWEIPSQNWESQFPGIRFLSREIPSQNWESQFPGRRFLSREIPNQNWKSQSPRSQHSVPAKFHGKLRNKCNEKTSQKESDTVIFHVEKKDKMRSQIVRKALQQMFKKSSKKRPNIDQKTYQK